MVGHRSTRNKMRFQMEKVINNIDRIFGHLQYLDELAGGASPFINEQLPLLTAAFEEMKKGCKKFRESL
ncbi:MAG: hypothetical protein HWN68_11170 [Desulfobacterales bacterium]|nr:hypothetical protein [Desulfobacterales bacterium]